MAGETMKTLDVIAIGRSSVDLYGQQIGSRLEDIASFAKSVGGCPSNIAIGTARLGLKSAVLTRVGDEAMGRFIREQLAREGVDTGAVKIDPERLTALVLLSVENEKSFPLIFYRENCADMALCESDVDESYFSRAEAIVVTGTHFSQPGPEAAQKKAMRIAKANGAKICFDIDYRPNLWGLAGHGAGDSRYIASDRVSALMKTVLPDCDLVVGTEEEIMIAAGTSDVLAALKTIRALSPATIVLKRGPMGCIVYDGPIADDLEAGIVGKGFPIEVYNVLGAGDAFMSGFLRGYLGGEDLKTAATWANACGAFAVSRLLCSPESPTFAELSYFLEHGSPHRALRKDEAINHVHWATTRRHEWPSLVALAIDHRAQLEEMAAEAGADPARIPRFKALAVEAAAKVAGGRPGFGMLLDERYGREAFDAAAQHGFWIGRPVEQPGSRPLRFEHGQDIGSQLVEWPVDHTIKCLCFYHPDDPAGLRDEQGEKLRALFEAARSVGRELLVEIIAGKNGPLDETTVARAMQQLYERGIKPDWWKLEPQASAAAWQAISEVIAKNDPWCRGILMLGLDAPQAELEAAFAAAAEAPLVKGFAVGRTIFAEPARAWLAGTIDDAAAVETMAERFGGLVEAWHRARGGNAVEGLREDFDMTGRTVRLTMAQALALYLSRQMTKVHGKKVPIFVGVWAIFGHGNVAALGEALYGVRDSLPTFRAHNEQAMAHAAVAYAKANFRRRFMACTTSIGPGATNLVTAAAVAHVNRLPLLLLPGDVFASRRPDPVLQQVEDFSDGTVSANDCLKPVSRYFDRLTRPEQLIAALPRAMSVLTDPAQCGPVTLCLCQDVQAEACDYPESFFAERIWIPRRPRADEDAVYAAAELIRTAKRPVIIAGGGVLYSGACETLREFAHSHHLPVMETQAGKSSIAFDDPLAMGSVGVTGTSASNALAEDADLVLAVGTRLQDFTTGSWALFKNPDVKIVGLNVQPFDAAKQAALPMVADAASGLGDLSATLGDWQAPTEWRERAAALKAEWTKAADAAKAPSNRERPSDGEVIGAVERVFGPRATVVCAAGGLPGELHKLWNSNVAGGYHLEYGFSCMGYEIAGGLGVKLAKPESEVVVMVGDGSYLMLNSELATSVMLGQKLTVVVLDNRGFGCINRLQRATGSAGFNNLLEDAHHVAMPEIDFAAHAASLGAIASKVGSIADLEAALDAAKSNERTTVVVIDTDPYVTTEAGGHWWDVAVPEVSTRAEVVEARRAYEEKREAQRPGF